MQSDKNEEIKKLVNVKLCEDTLRKTENNPEIQVKDVEFDMAVDKGNNYASDLVRATVKYTAGSEEVKKTIIIKVLPLSEGMQRNTIKNSTLFATEINMTTVTLVKMNELLSPDAPVSCKVLFVQEDPPIFIFEDLVALDYRMADRTSGLDEEHSILAIRALAKFHASSVALCEKDPTQKKMYKYGLYHNEQPNEIKAIIGQSVKNVGKVIANWPEMDPTISEKLIKLSANIVEKGHRACLSGQSEFNVINHGDSWVNNMMFKYNDKNQPTDAIFVDFQLCSYSSPMVDLMYFLNTSVADDVLAKKEDELFEEYLRVLALKMLQLNCRTKPPTMNELLKAMNSRGILKVIATIAILPLIVSDKDANVNEEELFNTENEQLPVDIGKDLRRILLRRLPIFDKQGLLD